VQATKLADKTKLAAAKPNAFQFFIVLPFPVD
jgi:hypothetical protein